jgi:hypothetical protein
MVLFHYSDALLTVLTPMIGGSRHGGEDPRAVGVPVVWLANQPQLSKPPKKYEYKVEVPDEDPDLCEDEQVARAAVQMKKMFGTEMVRWFFLKRSVAVKSTKVWDASQDKYI